MEWLSTSVNDALRIVISAVGIYVAVIVVIRINGLRSLAKMSSHDFAVTVAIGSILASTLLLTSPSLVEGILGLAVLVFCQYVVSRMRFSGAGESVVDNTPQVVMVGDRMLNDIMSRTRVTPDDVRAKLREANVIDYSQVYCVVLEATGDVSVLHSKDGKALDKRLLEGVRGADMVGAVAVQPSE